MRPLRLLISLSTSLVAGTLLLLLALGSPQQDEEFERTSSASNEGSIKALFSFTSPGSLFPPSAIISLTDDNSTFFLARPAAFGSALPKAGLSGPLWIGSGFGDDIMERGELGCGDVPGWEDGGDAILGASTPFAAGKSKTGAEEAASVKDSAAKEGAMPDENASASNRMDLDDGTDDHLQPTARKATKKPGTGHADIQSLQESAEMAGKVALLKRGGCGFLAKVQWAQKRGATAVIVGDDVRGGALIRMYAKGDTSNITIPSLFTSHTTAHLLSSLLPSEGSLREGMAGGKIKAGSIAKNTDADREKPGKSQDSQNRPSLTKSALKAAQSLNQDRQANRAATPETSRHEQEHAGWLHFLLSSLGFNFGDDNHPKAGSRRLPGSGDHDWVEVGDWDDDQKPIKTRVGALSPTSTIDLDDFIIGKQDWRDPDLLLPPSPTSEIQIASTPAPATLKTGGNVLPGSGEYTSEAETDVERKVWWSRQSESHQEGSSTAKLSRAKARSVVSVTSADFTHAQTSPLEPSSHQGLWVTLTPTNVSSSPFFDTLLVLVVSPLVTLTVVYALLLLRSRIRRRRWRAPKSVVDRLPVRTYQTISESSSSATPNASSPTTPLLQHSPPQPASSTQHLHSRPQPETSSGPSSIRHESRDREEEKRESGLAAWRRRYGGRQKECVVCLEEYEDGVSRVMSLPCGHEFHADCITPWLVTRRRTCPICKGDVVRSLSQSYHDRFQSPSPSPTRSSRFASHDDDVQTQAAETRNDSPSASRPVPISMSASADHLLHSDDIEAGWSGDGTRQSTRDFPENRSSELSSSLREMSSTVSTVIWRGVEAVRNTSGLPRRPPLADVDRNR